MTDEIPAAALFRYHFDPVYHAMTFFVGHVLTTYGLRRYTLCALRNATA